MESLLPLSMEHLRAVATGLLACAIGTTGCSAQPTTPATSEPGQLTVHYIDVGQADCELLLSEGSAMLIDAGNNADGDMVVDYLKSQGVTRLDYVVGTHPHEDHIGGLDDVINNFEVGTVIMPEAETNTKTFEDVLDAIDAKNLTITTPVPGDNYDFGGVQFTILAPNGDSYSSLNDYSVVIRLVNGQDSFLFTGDAETASEKEMLQNGLPLQSTVLKVGHHGSSTSSSEDFLNAVNPSYGIISCETGNDYGHPHQETLDRLQAHNISYFRTDTQGTIIASSDGNGVTFNTQPAWSGTASQAPTQSGTPTVDNNPAANDPIVVVTKSGSKYHRPDCSQIRQSTLTEMTRSEAIAQGYEPCKNCKPE